MLPKTSVPATTPRASKNIAPLAAPIAPPQGCREVTPQEMGKWDTPGQQVAGYFLGRRPSSKYEGRELLDLVDDDGIVMTLPCPVILGQLLLGVRERTAVMIHYLGEEETAKGETKRFQVFLGDVKP